MCIRLTTWLGALVELRGEAVIGEFTEPRVAYTPPVYGKVVPGGMNLILYCPAERDILCKEGGNQSWSAESEPVGRQPLTADSSSFITIASALNLCNTM